MASKIYEICSTSLAVREIQVQTTTRYHPFPVRIVVVKVKDSQLWQEGAEKKLLHTIGGNVN
jgi:hypothetical protein